MRIFLFLLLLAGSYCLEAQNTAASNYGPEFAKGHKANDLYKIEVVREDKTGYAVQLASFKTYPNVIKYATDLQGKWFDNILLKLEPNAQKQTIYKILLGPFDTRQAASEYQKSLKIEGYSGFVTSLAQSQIVEVVTVTEKPPTARPNPPTPPTPMPQPRPEFTDKGITPTFVPRGEASYYSDKFHGLTTYHGEQYNMHDYTAAHWTLPHHTKLKVCRIDNGKCVHVRVNDRGPNPAKAIARDGQPRIIDLSLAAAKVIELEQAGIAQVTLTIVDSSVPIGPTTTQAPPQPQSQPTEFTNKGTFTPDVAVSPTTEVFQTGEASYYAKKFHGRTTASGELFDMYARTAAHWTLPFNTRLQVCRLDNGQCVQVRVNDRGPNPAKAFGKDGKPRILDLSLAAAEEIGLVQAGVTQVSIKIVE